MAAKTANGYQAAGSVFRAFSTGYQMMQDASTEAANAQYYRDQAEFVRLATKRQAELAETEYTKLAGTQISAYSKSGVALSGSALSVVAETGAQKVEELIAIKQKGELDAKLARSRASQAQQKANMLGNPVFQVVNMGAGLLG